MEALREMASGTIPMRDFDLLAGAKASYEEFHNRMGTSPAKPWERLTQTHQLHWVGILKAGIKAAKDTREAKERRVT